MLTISAMDWLVWAGAPIFFQRSTTERATPISKRPPLRPWRVAAMPASTMGWRVPKWVVPVTRRIREVALAMAPSRAPLSLASQRSEAQTAPRPLRSASMACSTPTTGLGALPGST